MRLATLFVLAAAALAGPPPMVVAETTAQIKRNLKRGDFVAVRAAYGRAFNIRERYDDRRLAPVIRAIGGGVRHKDPAIALLSVEALERMRADDSTRYFLHLLKVAKTLKEDQRPLHLAAIRAAGVIHGPRSGPHLSRLLHHEDRQVAVAAANALSGYRLIDAKLKRALVRRLALDLSRLEKRKPRATLDRERVAAVTSTLVATLVKLTGDETIATSADVRIWIRKEKEKIAAQNSAFSR